MIIKVKGALSVISTHSDHGSIHLEVAFKGAYKNTAVSSCSWACCVFVLLGVILLIVLPMRMLLEITKQARCTLVVFLMLAELFCI